MTTINGGTLALTGSGSIANSSGVDVANAAGIFDISGTTTGASIMTLAGVTGSSVVLGDKTLTLSNASTTYNGVISGTNGALTLTAGTQTLSGANTYTGLTTINGGTLALTGSGSIANSSGVDVANAAGIFDISGTTTGASIMTLAGVTGSSVVLGDKTLTLSNASTTYNGVISGTNGALTLTAGTQTLAGANTYTGLTTINGGTLALTGSGSIANSSGVDVANAAGIFDISGTTTGASIMTLAGVTGSSVVLGDKTLTLSNASTTYNGVISGTNGALTLTAGTQTLAGANTYTGLTTINGGTLALTGSGSIANSSGVDVANAAGIFDISGTTTGASIMTLAGVTGSSVVLGDKTLTLSNASTTYNGVISGTNGALTLTAGTQTLAGANTYTGLTTINGGTLDVTGSIAASTLTSVNDGATLTGTGMVGNTEINTGGTFAPGMATVPGTSMTVDGNLVLHSSSVYEVEVNAAGQGDKVIVNGTVNLTGSVLHVLAANGNYNPQTDYVIIENDGPDAVVGNFSSITSSLAFLTPTVIYNGGTGNNDVVLTLVSNVGPGPGQLSFCSVADTRNQCDVAKALDLFPTDNPLFLAVLSQTAEGARQAFDALSGEIHATISSVLADDSRYVREAILGRLMQASYANGQVAFLGAGGPQVASLDSQAMTRGYDDKSFAAPSPAPRLAFWTRAYGAWGNFDGNTNAASADRDLGGFVSGMDAQVGGSWRAGLATGASFSNVDVDARYSSGQVKSYHLGGYLGGMAGTFALRGGGMWAWSDIDTSRAVVFPGFYERQKASYNADTGQLFGEAAYPMQMWGMALEPFAGLAYVSVDADNFHEHGGSLSPLNGRSTDENVGYTTLGLRAAQTMQWGAMLRDAASLRSLAACLRRRDAGCRPRLRHDGHRLHRLWRAAR